MTIQQIKSDLLYQLYAPYANCMSCPLSKTGRTNVVFGRGNPDAKLLIVGEGPGKEEDLQGIPFVGRSGKLLTKVLLELEFDPQDIYITNIVKCRPPANRTPTPEEANTCINLLLKNQIKIVSPQLICTLGSCATSLLLKSITPISKIRGTLQPYEKLSLMPTYHPAYILRNSKNLPFFVSDLRAAKNYINSNGK